jgi:predicted acyl esterase
MNLNANWQEMVSQPKYRMKVKKDVAIPMRDGINIAADIYYPDADSKFPVLIGISPYGKDIQRLPIKDFPTDTKLQNGGIEAGNSEFFVSRGYVHILADCRGISGSEGVYGVFTQKEFEDGYDIVEWAAKQPWCNGNAGMLGMSYFAMIQYGIAAKNPPHLKAIFPHDAASDMYRHWAYHGGILTLGFFQHWWPQVIAHDVEPPDIPPDQLKKIVNELKNNNEDIRSFPYAYVSLALREKNPHLFDALVHPFDGPFYWERSGYTKFDRIKVPSYLLSRWTAWAIHLPGAFSAYRHINAPKKLMITIPESGVGFNRPWHENHDLVLRWYDHWLKGINTGIIDEPPIKILVQGINQFRFENEWPLARTRWTKFYLRTTGLLAGEPPGEDEKHDDFANTPWLKPGETVPSLKYRTAVFTEDVEVTGPIALYLYASIDTDDTNWMVEVRDVDKDGQEKLVSMGWLKASHREIDTTKSQPYQPFHPHTRMLAIKPGEIYEYAIEIRETSMVFKTGHQIELVIKGQDAPWEGKEYFRDVFWHLPRRTKTHHSIYHTPKYPSYLLLPIIPK